MSRLLKLTTSKNLLNDMKKEIEDATEDMEYMKSKMDEIDEVIRSQSGVLLKKAMAAKNEAMQILKEVENNKKITFQLTDMALKKISSLKMKKKKKVSKKF
ncbi:hypothetical protein CHUAL_006202 [Chamberlinius hualienensis]